MASNDSDTLEISPASPIIMDLPTEPVTPEQDSQQNSQQSINLKFNKPSFELKDNDIYILKMSLFTRVLQPIDYAKERKALIQCTTCSYKKAEKVAGFQSSNYVAHYKRKHPHIAYNKESEKTKLLKQNIPSTATSTTTTDFFRKRLQTNTMVEFNEDEAYHKIPTFIIKNNLSFNILNSESFKDLLSYYNKSTPYYKLLENETNTR